jgi:hypothetical protein
MEQALGLQTYAANDCLGRFVLSCTSFLAHFSFFIHSFISSFIPTFLLSIRQFPGAWDVSENKTKIPTSMVIISHQHERGTNKNKYIDNMIEGKAISYAETDMMEQGRSMGAEVGIQVGCMLGS